MRILMLLTATTAAALSQQTSRTIQFTNLQTPQHLAEAATVIRSIGEIRDLTVDAGQRTITLKDDPAQIALTEWLVSRLDRIEGTSMNGAPPQDYRPAAGSDDVVRVFSFRNTGQMIFRQELTTMLRSLVEIRRAFLANASGAFVIRGTQEQVDAASWIMESLDQPAFSAGPRPYQISDAAGEGTIRFFPIAPSASVPELQSTAAELRTTTGIRRVFTYNPLRIVGTRGTPAQIEQAAAFLSKP